MYLSSICNLVGPTFYDDLEVLLSPETLTQLESVNRPSLKGLPACIMDTPNGIVNDGNEDLDGIMYRIHGHLYQLASDGKQRTEGYSATKMLEIMVENIGRYKSTDSELTSYRRVASLFDRTSINVLDGEQASSSTKSAMALSNLPSNDIRPTSVYGRKIDLIATIDQHLESIELSANEWKRPGVSDTISLNQQVKNVRTNAAILSKLIKMNCEPTTMSMDWIGNCGYLFYLTNVNDIFVANEFEKLIVPTYLTALASGVTTIDRLFMWRHHLCQTAKAAKANRPAENAKLCGVVRTKTKPHTITTHTPPIFFTSTSKKELLQTIKRMMNE